MQEYQSGLLAFMFIGMQLLWCGAVHLTTVETKMTCANNALLAVGFMLLTPNSLNQSS
jgi:hypothetical protein